MNGARGNQIPEEIFYIKSTGFSDTLNQGGDGAKRKTGVIHDFKVYSLFNRKIKKDLSLMGMKKAAAQ